MMQFRGPLGNEIRRYSAQGMGDAQRLKAFAPKDLGVPIGRVQERISADDYGWHSAVLQGHGVVHTARGAGPSIGDGGDDEIAPGGQVVDDIVSGWPGINVLIGGDAFAQLKVLFQ